MIHREALTSKEMSLGVNIVLRMVETVLNYIKTRSVK